MTALLLDQGLPYSAAQLLRAKGLDALHVADLAMGEALDETIIERARALGRTICTLVTVTLEGMRVRRLPLHL